MLYKIYILVGEKTQIPGGRAALDNNLDSSLTAGLFCPMFSGRGDKDEGKAEDRSPSHCGSQAKVRSQEHLTSSASSPEGQRQPVSDHVAPQS